MLTPLFGFFPVCMFFVSLAVLGVIVYIGGAGAHTAKPDEEPAAGPAERPPYWIAAVVLLACVIALLLLSLVTDG